MKRIGKFLAAALLVAAFAAAARADVNISASVDRAQVALNEAFSVSVTVSGGGNLPAPQLPDLSAFTVYSSGRSQNISFINGQMSSSIAYSYQLSPKSAGKFTIGSFSVTADGKTYKTDPIPVEVTAARQAAPAASAPQGQPAPRASQAPGAFVRMTVDKSRALVNEQVVLTFRFYYRIPLLSNPEYQPPALTGFVAEDMPPPRSFTESAHGLPYHVSEIKTALFPAQAGRVTIPPALLKIGVQDVSGGDPFSDDFFRQFFSGGAREVLLKTNPLALTVLPLPAEGKPKDFTGGVGSFGIAAALDKTKPAVGEPLTLTVTVAGTGNIQSLGDPEFPDFAGFRKYDTAGSLNIDKSKGLVSGSKIYKIVLVPQASGRQTIPSIAFGFFDPAAGKYKTLRTHPMTVEVAPGKPGGGLVLSPGAPALPGIQTVNNREIRYIKTEVRGPDRLTWIVDKPGFLWLNLLPILGLLGAAVYRGRSALLGRNPERRRASRAYRKARKRLDRIRAGEPLERRAEEIFEALRDYLADKMLVPQAGLTLKMSEDYLMDAGAAPDALKNLRALWSDLELVRYAPAQFRSPDLERLAQSARGALDSCEGALKKSAKAAALRLIAFAVPLALAATAAFSALDPAKFQEANRNYRNGQFQAARDGYKQLADAGTFNAALEYDLGNASYRLGRPGEAIAHWIRAWRMRPRDPDIRFNLALASSQAGDPFFADFFLARWLDDLYHALNLNELTLLWLAVLWLACLAWGADLVRAASWLRLRNGILLVGLAGALVWWGARLREERFTSAGVVAAGKAEVRSGPGNQFAVGFTIPEGRRVLILTDEAGSDWLEIGVAKEGLKGWVERSKIVFANLI